jgi:hypothetical protein
MPIITCITSDAECECDWATITYYYLDASYTEDAWVCIDVSFGGEDWSIDLSFFFDETSLTNDDYAWLLEQDELGSATYDCSGTDTPNEVDNIVNQYPQKSAPVTPACGYFTYRPDGYVGWQYVQSHESPVPNYAIYMSVLDDNLRQLHTDTAYTIAGISRIYSTPNKNSTIPGAAVGSQHIYGNAVDIDIADSAHWAGLREWGYLLVPVPCSEPWSVSHTHVHFDYRGAPGAIYAPACTTEWQIPPR